jgi:hypothetical protein
MNNTSLQRTRFVDLHLATRAGQIRVSDQPKEKNTSFGYRLYDDHAAVYCNTMSGNDLICSDAEFLKKVSELSSDDMGRQICWIIPWTMGLTLTVIGTMQSGCVMCLNRKVKRQYEKSSCNGKSRSDN